MKLEPLSTNESLKDWFGKGPKGDWVRVGTDGKIKGDCAREPGEGKPKCMPRSKAHSMSKKDRATSARRKRRQDPQVDRPGTGNKPINVKTDVKEKCWDGWKQMGMKKKGKRLVPNCVKEEKPSGKATKPYSSHGIPKDATKAELKAIRSNPNSSKGKKQLAHWKLNMHKEEYPAGAEADMKKLYKHKTPSSKTMDAMYKDYKNNQKLKKVNMVGQSSQNNEGMMSDIKDKVKASPLNMNTLSRKRAQVKVDLQKRLKRMDKAKMEGTYMGTFDRKAVDKYMSKKKKAPKPASDEYKRKLAKAYGIKQEAMDDIKKRLQDKSNRVKDADMAKKMQKVAFRHRTEAKDGITKKEKYMMTGRHLYDPKQGLQLEAPQDKGLSGSNRSKMDQLFRMGLIAKDERQLFLRALKRGSAALKDPLLRNKLYELLRSMMKIVTDDQQIYRQFRQHVQMNKKKGSGKGAFDVQEALVELSNELLNKSFEVINISEDMSGMSVSSGHKRSVAQGAGMTKKGVNAYKRRNPGSKLKTAVTTPPSKLKPGSKPAKRRKAFCSRSRSWTSERGKAARRRWNC